MDIRHLRYFIAIGESNSLSEAAGKLNIAQPSLSQHLSGMESELGIKLVVRTPRGSSLTPEGKVLLHHAHEISTLLKRCLTSMKELAEDINGTVRFGLPPSLSMVMSVPLAETVRVELPQVRLRASEAMSGFIKTWLNDETVEIGCLYDLDGVEHFVATHILDEQLHFFSAPDAWPLQTEPGEPVPLRALQDVELVLPSAPHGLRHAIEQAARGAGLKLNVVTELDAMTQIKELVARGSGSSIFAPAACYDFVEIGRLIMTPIIEPVIERPVYLVRNPNVHQTRACAAIEQLTLNVASDLVRRGFWDGRLATRA